MGERNLDNMAYLGNIVSLSVEAPCLEHWNDNGSTWWQFQDNFLKHVCAARNTPSPPDRDDRQNWWLLNIALLNVKPKFDYIRAFSASTDAALKDQLPPDSTFSQAYQIVRQGSNLMLHVSSSKEGLATKDYKTKLSTNKGLLKASSPGMEVICYHLYRKAQMNGGVMARPEELRQSLRCGHPLSLSEDARLHFKGLEVGCPKCTNKMRAQERTKRFWPRTAKNYVEWIWGWYPQGLGDYISAFTKNEEGGAIYYGVNEFVFGYMVVGLPLPYQWRRFIATSICEKVCRSMLWVKRDPSSPNGYRISTPEEIKRYFTVDFIQVSHPEKVLCILEVRVSPFNGIVFNDPQGPEAYRMQEEGGEFKPVRLSKEVWLAQMRLYGWCTMHRRPKERQCPQCVLGH